MTKFLEWGSTQRQKASSKVIFLLHCTGLAQLSSYAIVGAYNFSRCNHNAIIKDYQNVVQETILNIPADQPKKGTIHNCCSQKKPEGALLACISNFTQRCIAPQHSGIMDSTVALLAKNCDGYSPPNNGSQDIQVTFNAFRKCQRQRKNKPCGNSIISELKEMWDSYLRSISL